MPGRWMVAALALLTWFVAFAGAAPAQPGDGHIVLGVNTTLPKIRSFMGSIVAYDPAQNRFTTLVSTTPRFDTTGSFGSLSVASDNRGLVALGMAAGGAIIQTYRKITMSGAITTVAQGPGNSIVGYVSGDLILDGDGGWLAVGPRSRGLLRLDDTTHVLTTLFDLGPASLFQHYCGIAPRLEKGDGFWVLNWDQRRFEPPLYTATRKGVITTIVPGGTASWIDLSTRIRSEPQTGAIWTSRRVAASTTGGALLVRRDLAGKVTTLRLGPGLRVADLRIAQDGSIWAIESRSTATSFPADILYHVATDGTVILARNIAGTGSNATSIGAAVSLDIYGRRRLVVNGSGKPGSRALITVASLKPSDAGLAYQLACSFARRPGLRPRTGEWLHLAPDALFTLSISGAAPGLFVRFAGYLSPSGRATAALNVPAALPSGLDLPIFVAGVIYDGGGVRTVTNTHWLVLR